MSNTEGACKRCNGCGKIADSKEGEEDLWAGWGVLMAAKKGLVKTIDCPECGSERRKEHPKQDDVKTYELRNNEDRHIKNLDFLEWAEAAEKPLSDAEGWKALVADLTREKYQAELERDEARDLARGTVSLLKEALTHLACTNARCESDGACPTEAAIRESVACGDDCSWTNELLVSCECNEGSVESIAEQVEAAKRKIRLERLAAMRKFLGPQAPVCEPAWHQDVRDIIELYDDSQSRLETASECCYSKCGYDPCAYCCTEDVET